jgi:BolA protein
MPLLKNKKTQRLTADAERVTRWCMTVADTIRQKLTSAFSPVELVVEDDSARHDGHSGARPGGETHFSVKIVSPAFAGTSRLERQRRIHAVLADELNGRVHALVLVVRAPGDGGS